MFEKTIHEYGDFSISRGGQKITFAQLAESGLRGVRQIGAGKAAPEIEGEDVDGKSFRLSDYRGKVVMLVFTGEWCGPCRAMYPQERELVSRLKDKPFALLAIDTDTERQTLRKAISAGEVTWRCWWDGAMDGANLQGMGHPWFSDRLSHRCARHHQGFHDGRWQNA